MNTENVIEFLDDNDPRVQPIKCPYMDTLGECYGSCNMCFIKEYVERREK